MNILDSSQFVFKQTYNLNLSDIVVCYYDNNKWKMIPIGICKKYPIIYDNDLSILTCPYTMAVGVFYGRYKLTNKINITSLIKLDDGSYSNLIDKISTINRISEVFMCTLQNALHYFIDSVCLTLTDSTKFRNTIDKKLCYLIRYNSKKDNNKTKFTVVLNKNIKQGYDIQKSGFYNYFTKNRNKLVEKNGVIIPIYYDAVDSYKTIFVE